MKDRNRRFEGKVALVTGAASGVGRQTAQRLAAEGGRVVGVDLDASGLAGTGSECPEGSFHAVVQDLGSAAACRAAVAAALEIGGGLDVLCNVAGMIRFHLFLEMPEEDWQRTLAVNVSSAAFMCQAALPHLIERRGAIVNVSSAAASQGQAYTVAYCASKAALSLLTRALAMEFMDAPVRINAVAPGGIDTPMGRENVFPEGMDWKKVTYVGARGMAQPGEIAEVVVFLASEEASNVHGAIWAVDGGMTAG